MSQPGIGSMLHILSGGSEHSASEYYGQKIIEARLKKDDPATLTLKLENGKTIELSDDGQSCCESRYITSDDDPESLVGEILRKIEVKKSEEKEGEWGTHEICFVEVGTDKSSITLCTHNEHNGYYGGFGLTIKEV